MESTPVYIPIKICAILYHNTDYSTIGEQVDRMNSYNSIEIDLNIMEINVNKKSIGNKSCIIIYILYRTFVL